MTTEQPNLEGAGVTTQELTEWLRAAGLLAEDASVTDVRAEPMGDGLGFTGRLERLTLAFDGEAADAPRTLILKQAIEDPDVREVMTGNGLYEREVRFYNELAGRSDIQTPACYFAAMDESGGFRMVLEDIGPDTSLDQVAGATEEQARGIIEALARFHAGWWGESRLEGLDWTRLSDGLITDTKRRYSEALPSFRERMEEAHPRLCGYAEQAVGLLDLVDADQLTKHDTLTHGDFRLDNILVRPGRPDEFLFADWQLFSRGLGATDLARFLAESVDTELRRELQDELFGLYHSTLMDAGVRGYSRRRLRQDFQAGLLVQMVLFVVATDALEWDRIGGRGQLLAETLAARLEQMMNDEKMGRLMRLAPWVLRFQKITKRLKGLLGGSRRRRA